MGDSLEAREELIGVDHISHLPDCVIHTILSLLPKTSRDAARTCTLSKRWNQLWSTYPYMVYFHSPSYNNYVRKQLHLQPYYSEFNEHDCMVKFLDFLDSSIQPRLQRNEYIYRFQMHIDFPSLEMLTPFMDRWIRLAMGKDTIEFDLYTFYYKMNSYRKFCIKYVVPQSVFISKTLKSLRLYGCKLDWELDIKLPRLEKLELFEVWGLDAEMIGNFIRGCPSLQQLFLVCCKELESVAVAGVPHLKHATFNNCYSLRNIEIIVPNLHEFAFDIPSYDDEEDVCEINLSTCLDLKRLRLSGVTMSFQSLMPIILNTEVLELKKCYSLEQIQLPVQNFKKFVFNQNRNISLSYKFDKDLMDPPCQDSDMIIQTPGMPFSSMKILQLQEIHLQLPLKDKDLCWWSSWKEFLTSIFCQNLKVALYNPYNDTIVLHENLSEVSLSSIFQDKTLWRGTNLCISSRGCLDILDVLLWETRSTRLSVVCPCGSKLIESLYQKPLRVHSGFQHWFSWCRFLGFEMTNSQPVEFCMDDALKTFLYEHSVGDYHASTFKLKWRMTIMDRTRPARSETNKDLDVSLTSLHFI